MQKVVAYLRVSTFDQPIEKNKTDILRSANQHDLEKVRFVEEVAPGRIPRRESASTEGLKMSERQRKLASQNALYSAILCLDWSNIISI